MFITLRRVVLRHQALRRRATRLSAEQLKPPEEEDDRGQQEHLHCDEDEEADPERPEPDYTASNDRTPAAPARTDTRAGAPAGEQENCS